MAVAALLRLLRAADPASQKALEHANSAERYVTESLGGCGVLWSYTSRRSRYIQRSAQRGWSSPSPNAVFVRRIRER